jgi:hypothetical protein
MGLKPRISPMGTDDPSMIDAWIFAAGELIWNGASP